MFLRFHVVSTTFMPSFCGMLLYSERTSIVAKMLFSGILPRLFIFLMRSVESLTLDFNFFLREVVDSDQHIEVC